MTRAAVLLIALCGALAACGPAGADERRSSSPKLFAFESCTELVRYARRGARVQFPTVRRKVEGRPMPTTLPTPMPSSGPGGGQEDAGGGRESNRPTESSGATGGGGGAADVSQTNVQEAGVDEPDILKSDGSTIYALTGGTLRAIDGRAATPQVLGSLPLGDDVTGLLRHGTKLLAIGEEGGSVVLREIDATDPAAMRVVTTERHPGGFVDGRLVGGTARLVLQSEPRAVYASRGSHLRTRPGGWTPPGTPCGDVARPEEYSGLNTVTVLTIDLDQGLPAVDRDAVLADAQLVYASAGGLYVATQAASESGEATAIHRFDTTDPRATTYSGSGEVPGSLLNQFALSEHEGALRAATSKGAGGDGRSESLVTVLAQQGDRLGQIGQVGGLGRGERIFGVRFIGAMGYVVTFRQTDPLYTVDLSQPNNPAVRGELKILGYSAYLHPAGDGLLLGLGQDADEGGRRKGTQLSLFDVSDPANPTRLHQLGLGTGESAAESDHHAFLHWAPTGLVFVPASHGGVGVKAGRSSLNEVARVVHAGSEPIQRAMVMGDRVFTLSATELRAHELDGLRENATLPLR